MEWYIVSFLNERQTTIGGVRATKLNQYLNSAGYTSELLTRQAINKNEVSIPEPFFAGLPGLSKLISPDSSVFWTKKVYNYLNCKSNYILFTTSPLHGVHKLGLKLKRKKNKNFIWIADFRDPFTLNPFYHPFFHKRILDEKYEKEIFKKADFLVFNTDVQKDEYMSKYKFLTERKCVVVRNGFDYPGEEIFFKRENKIIYSGGIYKGEAIQACAGFLKTLKKGGINIECDFIGEDHENFKLYEPLLNYKGRVAVEEVPKVLSKYNFGLVYLPKKFKNSGRIAAKLYDYIGAGLRPLCINPTKDMQLIIDELGYGLAIEEHDLHNAAQYFKAQRSENFKIDNHKIYKYSRESQFKILISFLTEKGIKL